jgi:hypothetical protein
MKRTKDNAAAKAALVNIEAEEGIEPAWWVRKESTDA